MEQFFWSLHHIYFFFPVAITAILYIYSQLQVPAIASEQGCYFLVPAVVSFDAILSFCSHDLSQTKGPIDSPGKAQPDMSIHRLCDGGWLQLLSEISFVFVPNQQVQQYRHELFLDSVIWKKQKIKKSLNLKRKYAKKNINIT